MKHSYFLHKNIMNSFPNAFPKGEHILEGIITGYQW